MQMTDDAASHKLTLPKIRKIYKVFRKPTLQRKETENNNAALTIGLAQIFSGER